MNISKISIYVTIVAVILIIGIPTVYKVISTNYEHVNMVNEKLAIEKAKQCIYESKCNNKKVTLKMLKDNKYITEDIVDPKTKAICSDDSYVIVSKEDSKFYPIF